MNYEEIMVRLQKGDTMETIAKEIEDALNKANADFQEQNKKDAEEAKLNELADTMAAAATEYLRILRPAMVKEAITGAELRQTLDEMLPLLDLFGDFKVQVKTSMPKAKKTPEDAFAKFFKSMNI